MRIIYSHPGVSSTKAFCFFEQRQEFCFIVGRQSTFVRSKPFFEQRQELKVSWDNNEGTLPCWEVRSICFFAGELHEHIRGCLVSMRDSSLSRHKLTFASHLRPDLCLDLSQSAVHQYHFLQKIILLFIHAVMWLYFLITGQTSKLLSHRLREKLELLHLLWRLTKGFCNWSPLPQPVPRMFSPEKYHALTILYLPAVPLLLRKKAMRARKTDQAYLSMRLPHSSKRRLWIPQNLTPRSSQPKL